MSQPKDATAGVQTAAMPKAPTNISRAALAELIKRTNQTPVRITAQS
jgi:hypothetical protein